MNIQHTKFLDRLSNSARAVFAVALNQHRKGRTVEIGAIRYAPSADQAERYVDDGDITIVTRSIIEVKHLGVTFTSAADWPFKEVFVSNVAAVDRRRGSVIAYVSVSSDLRHVCVVHKNTSAHWYVTERRASNTGNVERFYACPVAYATFESMEFCP